MEIKNLTVNLSQLTTSNQFLLLDIQQSYAYVEGKKTDQIIGYRYTLGDLKTCTQFTVRVEQLQPLITQEEFSKLTDPVNVTLENAFAKLYVDRNTSKLTASITAQSIKPVKGAYKS